MFFGYVAALSFTFHRNRTAVDCERFNRNFGCSYSLDPRFYYLPRFFYPKGTREEIYRSGDERLWYKNERHNHQLLIFEQ